MTKRAIFPVIISVCVLLTKTLLRFSFDAAILPGYVCLLALNVSVCALYVKASANSSFTAAAAREESAHFAVIAAPQLRSTSFVSLVGCK